MARPYCIGIIGGSGALGGAIARALLRDRLVAPERLWISNRPGTASGFEEWPGIRFATQNQELVDACQTVPLSVPPHLVAFHRDYDALHREDFGANPGTKSGKSKSGDSI